MKPGILAVLLAALLFGISTPITKKLLLSALCMGAGSWILIGEQHSHEHCHERIAHEHAPLTHCHLHTPGVHHRHAH